MKRWVALLLYPALIAAAAPTALVTGAVRDQFGDPIPGAVVAAGSGRTTTDTDGTFALEASGVDEVIISCSYCSRTTVRVSADGRVVAIVRRYGALTQAAPSSRDLLALPYAHVEDDVSLRPFTELNASSNVLPGPRVSTYGASAFGGLLIDNGIPQYDIAAGTSAWRAFPNFDFQNVDVRDQRDAFRYGDMAGGGTFPVDTQPGSGAFGLLSTGNASAFYGSQALRDGAYNAAASSDDGESRTRVDATGRIPVSDNDLLTVTGILSQDRVFPVSGGGIGESADGVRAHFESTRTQRVFADLIADRSGYQTSNVNGIWSDVTTDAGVVSNTPVQLFATLSARWSTGFYDASQVGIPRVAGTVTQYQGLLGAQRAGQNYSFQGGVSVFSIAYTGGTHGTSQPLNTTILTPSLSGSYDFDSHWQVDIAASGAFRLPSLLEAYARPPSLTELVYDRYGSTIESIAYTDTQRVRVSLLAMSERVTNLDNGMVHSAGAQIAWQVAPTISLRVWGMHVNDTTHAEYPLFRFARTPHPANVGSAWLTYDLPDGLRVDAIYRRDLTDFQPNPHFDASISAPLTSQLRWFAATEKRDGQRYVSAGLRLNVP